MKVALVNLAVNGTLMRGFRLNQNLLDVKAVFIRETSTSPHYRLWSIDDEYPAMIRDENPGGQIEVEIWKLSQSAMVTILQKEPPGLCIGQIELEGSDSVFGVLGEPYIVIGQKEITAWKGWRNYLQNQIRDE
jgi:hypothetical protein